MVTATLHVNTHGDGVYEVTVDADTTQDALDEAEQRIAALQLEDE